MSSHAGCGHDASSSKPLPLGQWAALAVLFLLEVLAFNFQFDLGDRLGDSRSWVERLGQLYLIPRPAIAMLTAALLLGWRQWRAELLRRADEVGEPGRRWPFLLGHLLAMAGVYQVTLFFRDSAFPHSAHAGLWTALRLALGLAAFLCWWAAALPVRLWLPLVRQGRRALLAGAVVGVLAWKAGTLTGQLWQPLHRSTFWAVQTLLGLCFADAHCDPATFVVGTSAFTAQIGQDCSGYEGIGLTWAFLTVCLFLDRKNVRFPHVLLLYPIGTAAIWAANAVRITALVAIGTLASPEVAVSGFHSQAGWLAFNGVALGLVVLMRRARFCTVRTEPAPAEHGPNTDAAYLLPLLAVIGASMPTGAMSSDFDHWYPVRVLLGAVALWAFRPIYARLCWRWSWEAVGMGVLAFAVWMALEPAPADTHWMALPAWLAGLPAAGTAVWLGFRVVGSVVVVPLAEELAFRGYLPRRLQTAHVDELPLGRFAWLPFLVSSLLFGALHGRWLAGTLAGMLYALVLYRRKDLAAPVLAHATTNALIAVCVLTTQSWSLWA